MKLRATLTVLLLDALMTFLVLLCVAGFAKAGDVKLALLAGATLVLSIRHTMNDWASLNSRR